jgi:nicotinic acid mononucleotide adenylyltransferase
MGLDWILGSDQWTKIRQWRDYRELGRLVRFLVFPRPEAPKSIPGLRMRRVPLRIDLSASEIRLRLKTGQPIKGMVLPEVEKILKHSGSYRS